MLTKKQKNFFKIYLFNKYLAYGKVESGVAIHCDGNLVVEQIFNGDEVFSFIHVKCVILLDSQPVELMREEDGKRGIHWRRV